MIDDTIAVTMGGIEGAQVVIVGAIQGEGKSKRLLLRALDVEEGGNCNAEKKNHYESVVFYRNGGLYAGFLRIGAQSCNVY
jgi:hypothetical protein